MTGPLLLTRPGLGAAIDNALIIAPPPCCESSVAQRKSAIFLEGVLPGGVAWPLRKPQLEDPGLPVALEGGHVVPAEGLLQGAVAARISVVAGRQSSGRGGKPNSRRTRLASSGVM